MKVATVTYLKENAHNLVVEEPRMITKNGNPAYVVQSAADYQYQQDTVALLKLLTLSERSALQNEYLSEQNVFDEQ
jgi:PHD/YefM family antitoxin component YafN of YafNO toxin-antitoxin module